MKTSLITLLLVVATVTLFSQENDVDKANEAISNFKKTNSEIENFSIQLMDMLSSPALARAALEWVAQLAKELYIKGEQQLLTRRCLR